MYVDKNNILLASALVRGEFTGDIDALNGMPTALG